MSRATRKLPGMLLLLVFVVGFAGCLYECATGEDAKAAVATPVHAAGVSCLCLNVGWPSTATVQPQEFNSPKKFVLRSYQLTPLLLAASIFNPPKV